jgi:deazaflavin-dependent oxidoreductase (nitroreductase family)
VGYGDGMPEMSGGDGDVVDSPTPWVAKHIAGYVETGGRRGHRFYGAPALLLTTRGRTSGLLRRTALYYGRYPDDLTATGSSDAFVVVASNGGATEDPQWFRNLVADPTVHLQVGAEHYDGRARVATPEERPRLWAAMTAVWPAYEDYRGRTDREIPVVVIDVVSGAGPAT